MNVRDLPETLRARLRADLPERAFIQRARGEGLFVTNACPRDDDWFFCRAEGTLVTVFPSKEWILSMEAMFPEPADELSRTLLRTVGCPMDDNAPFVLSEGLKALESGRQCGYDTRVRKLAALNLRKHTGGAYLCALLLAEIKKYKGE